MKAKPDLAEAHYKLAKAYEAAGDPIKAYGAYARAADLEPSNMDAQLQAGALLLSGGEYAVARTRAELAIKADPDNPAAHILLGNPLAGLNDTASAVKQMEQAIRLDPSYAPAWSALGAAQFVGGNRAEAGRAFEKAVALSPQSARNPNAAALHLEIGNVALQRRQTASARAAYEEALRLQPSLHDARVGLITADIAEKNLPAAEPRLADWQAQAPGDASLRVLSARVDLVAGRTAEAERTLREVVTADASQLEAYDLLGRLYMSLGQVDRAVAEYRVLAERTKTPAGALTMIALIQEAKGDRDSAHKQYEQILAAHPRSGVAANNLAWIYAERGKPDEAVKLARVAQDELRGRPEAEDTLGWAYYHKGLTGHAIAAFERALTKAPDNPVYHYHLGLAHAKAGSDSHARAALERALSLKADFAGAEDARERLRALSDN